MVLKYYEEANFGDAINPVIFNTLLPDFFDKDESTIFLGIGSTLGFLKGDEKTKKIVVFSTGFAYDEAPEIDAKYDIRCVRGPLTASALKLDPSIAVTDGALLLRSLPQFNKPVEKKYKFSFIPHHKSEMMFNRWEVIFSELDINYISPRKNPEKVIEQIRQSECVLSEAMHGAIIADCFRVPWIPVKMFEHINDFKWKDWLMSVELNYSPVRVSRLYNREWIKWIIYDKFSIRENTPVNKLISGLYKYYQICFLEDKFRKDLIKITKNSIPNLSREDVLKSQEARLLKVLDDLKRDYQVVS